MGRKSRAKQQQSKQRRVQREVARISQPTITARDMGPDGSIATVNRHLAELRRAERRVQLERRKAAELVELLRAEGCSWTVIGEQIGMTRQAAASRYARRLSESV